jgi:hypothetical protein
VETTRIFFFMNGDPSVERVPPELRAEPGRRAGDAGTVISWYPAYLSLDARFSAAIPGSPWAGGRI